MPAATQSPLIRVLVVEDREEDYLFLEHVFQQADRLRVRLEWARSYPAGVAALRRGEHDIAFFDYSLGAETGIDLLGEAAAMGCTLPIILLTGHDSAEVDEAASRAGAVDFLEKGTLDRVHLERAVRYALRQAEMRAALRASQHRLLTVTDAEQQRIGADLHDGLGQQLTGLSCLAAALRDRLQREAPEAAAQAGTIAQLASDAIAQARALARGLCPVQLENAGLLVALEEMAVNARTLHGIDARFVVKGAPPACDHLAALHLYRIAQEAVHNAVRHGKARQVRIELSSRQREHRLVITDDGCGFAPAAHGQAPGGGLRLMGYRAAMIGGVFSADSQPGHGTRITCHFTTFILPHENDRIGKESPDAQGCEVAC
jgi:signal transduction histidine kinase